MVDAPQFAMRSACTGSSALGAAMACTMLSLASLQARAEPSSPPPGPSAVERSSSELRALVERYPQDYALVLELAWVEFQARRYAEAARHYRTAVSLSLGARDARLGLGWSLAYLGRCDEARVELHAARALDPSDARAREGLEACAPGGWLAPPPAVSWYPSFSVTGHVYVGNADRDLGVGPAAGLSAVLFDHGLLGAFYRLTDLPVRVSGGQGGGGRRTHLLQHELWLGAGFTTAPVGFVARYGAVLDRTGYSGTSHALGGSLRWSFGWDAYAEGGVSLYDTSVLPEAAVVGSTAVGLRIPLGSYVAVRPGLRLGFVDGNTYGAFVASAGIDTGDLELYLGGTLGRERLPVHWSVPVVYNLPERLAEGLMAGASLELAEGWRASADYQLRRLIDEPDGAESGMHLFTIGILRAL
jgi:hypothetical protein